MVDSGRSESMLFSLSLCQCTNGNLISSPNSSKSTVFFVFGTDLQNDDDDDKMATAGAFPSLGVFLRYRSV